MALRAVRKSQRRSATARIKRAPVKGPVLTCALAASRQERLVGACLDASTCCVRSANGHYHSNPPPLLELDPKSFEPEPIDPHVSVVTLEHGVNDDASQADWYSPPEVPKELNTDTSLELSGLDSNLDVSHPFSELVCEISDDMSEVPLDEK
jgi:hypothetical protein